MGTILYSLLYDRIRVFISSFMVCCRLVIAIDGTHLKRKYKGVLFVIITMDGNEQIYPLAFGFGDLENDRGWTWFLIKL